ncbi:MAG: chromate transporter [Acetatifactor sp.]|nr:chromate transporter [Acetatifactor sp.]
MIYFRLFWSFLKIGFTSFGGLSMIPLISSEMLSHNWMTAGEVSDIVAIAEMTPGPLGLNCATFAGMRTAGFLGALAANLGVLMPSFTLCLIAAVFFARFKEARLIQNVMIGVRPACLAMVIGVCLTLSCTNYIESGGISVPAVVIGVLDAVLLLIFRISIPKVIMLSAVLGLVVYGVVLNPQCHFFFL